jgi:hypothetical protein
MMTEDFAVVVCCRNKQIRSIFHASKDEAPVKLGLMESS